ncbi:hypothetical protein [Sphingomonas sp.]|uniref:hypothetical protein n=1 Tax=Sphingomonas sp. TaxID=28214 RepID=UPI0017D97497|nr:hypothetical protein [Sphingomonas sp.]MBA3510892.1 hypothetical protein [Sphingomonas sp.]
MSGRSFRSVFMVASCAGAALGCYLVSLRVASERAALEHVETRIVLAQRDIRLLQTEIGTRGRLAQLERWNVKVLALSAPSADQFLDGGFALARLVAPQDKVDLDAPVVLAAAPANGPKPQVEGRQPQPAPQGEGVSAGEMLHVASLKRALRPAENAVAAPRAEPEKPIQKPAASAKAPAAKVPSAKTAKAPLATAKRATAEREPATTSKAPPTKVAKAPPAKAKPATAERKPSASDPLAPLASAAKPKKLASTTNASGKDSGSKQ